MKEKLLFPNGCIAVLGMFDGVHVGHQALLKRAILYKKKFLLPIIMLTFDIHPKALFGNAPAMLTNNEQKKKLAMQFGADEVLFETFDQKMRSLTPEQFITEYLIKKLNVRCVIVGKNYRFGYQHTGTAELLQKYSALFSVEIVPSVLMHGLPVSSSRIRNLLQEGKLEEALMCLGHPLEAEGMVEPGRQVGRRLGFCTANVDGIFPPLKYGVYLTRCKVENEFFPSISNFGVVPTFSLAGSPRMECHLLNFEGNLYQKEMLIQFVSFVRPERKFSNEQELTCQVKSDILAAKKYFFNSL